MSPHKTSGARPLVRQRPEFQDRSSDSRARAPCLIEDCPGDSGAAVLQFKNTQGHAGTAYGMIEVDMEWLGVSEGNIGPTDY